MCLGIPGKIINILDDGPLTRTGKVSFGGILKEINLAYTPEASVGDYVIVHAGFSISKINEQEASRVFDYLDQMGEIQELDSDNPKP
ncbi:MAG TPA: HypC/HybG/HupF family hydrogenase formation chaperone [Nitrospiria bacterium]|jgi:hydrogenase expression/formation protein HypC